ncbi:hypothetical protein ACIQGW_15875 [Lysinibacillus xylanilyticus]|uniref:hypothetical protein n=1 Tax=Lysinibacillus xylanilyticus TaxID=582475 RepID=UPI00381E4858
MNKIAYRCLDNPTHSFFGSNNMEGITCPVCQFQVIPTGYYDPECNELPHYNDFMKQCATTDNINDYNECFKCGSENHSKFYLDNSIAYAKCDECGFLLYQIIGVKTCSGTLVCIIV